MPPIAGGESDHDGQSPNGAPRNGRGFLMRT
jgi:hypothetical protein